MLVAKCLPFLLLVSCSSSSSPTVAATQDGGGGSDSGADAATVGDAGARGCQTVPAGITPSGPACTTSSGQWSATTVDLAKKTSSTDCNQAESTIYEDQASFDANEGTSTAPGVTIVSKKDFVRTATCASGSIDYTAAPDPKTTILFVWTKQP